MFFSAIAGSMYDTAGFKSAYFLLGLIAITFTIISIFTLSNDKKGKKKEQRDPELVNAV
ncbi:MFS transporter [Priestia flexa]|uniref:MFS transporter n=1 Tax=Priestia flexa TaxID=86664 RepID=UPI0032B5A4FF